MTPAPANCGPEDARPGRLPGVGAIHAAIEPLPTPGAQHAVRCRQVGCLASKLPSRDHAMLVVDQLLGPMRWAGCHAGSLISMILVFHRRICRATTRFRGIRGGGAWLGSLGLGVADRQA